VTREIPDDIAVLMADLFRGMQRNSNGALDFDHWINLLDPQPAAPTLRDELAEILRDTSVGSRWEMADEIIDVVIGHVNQFKYIHDQEAVTENCHCSALDLLIQTLEEGCDPIEEDD
jgi:hypothetical protein